MTDELIRTPYSTPQWVKSGKRCQFSLPGKKYNCRCVGAYELSGKFYCASHYDTAWKRQNPIIGQQHEWGDRAGYPCCLRCGSIRVHEGLPQAPCRGHAARIVLWSNGNV